MREARHRLRRVRRVRRDPSRAHFWDITSIDALDKVVHKFRQRGVEVDVHGLSRASATRVRKFGAHEKTHTGAPITAGR